MGTIKHSQFTRAENITDSDVVIVQSGRNKIAAISLFTSFVNSIVTSFLTFTNGLTKTDTTVKLGGDLTEATTIGNNTDGKIALDITSASKTVYSVLGQYGVGRFSGLYCFKSADQLGFRLQQYDGSANTTITANVDEDGENLELRSVSALGNTAKIEIKGGGNGNASIRITSPKINISGIPTSASGLSAGDVWNDGGTLKIVT